MQRNTVSIAALKRKVRSLEFDLQKARAEADLYQMMAHDLAGPAVIATITAKYPQIAKEWERYDAA